MRIVLQYSTAEHAKIREPALSHVSHGMSLIGAATLVPTCGFLEGIGQQMHLRMDMLERHLRFGKPASADFFRSSKPSVNSAVP